MLAARMAAARGFTIIELMIAVAIVGLLTVIAAPSYSTWVQSVQIRGASSSILSGLQLARSEAIKRNKSVRFVFENKPATSWTVLEVASGAQIETRSSADGSPDVQIETTPAATTTVTFNAFGRVEGGVGVTVEAMSSKPGSEARKLKTVLEPGGMARLCDPLRPAGSPQSCS